MLILLLDKINYFHPLHPTKICINQRLFALKTLNMVLFYAFVLMLVTKFVPISTNSETYANKVPKMCWHLNAQSWAF